jgi:competence protein ComEC
MNWREYPMARLLLPLMAGIWWGTAAGGGQQWAQASITTTTMALLLGALAYWQQGRQPYQQRWCFGLALSLFLLGAGLLLSDVHDERRHPRHFASLIPEGEEAVIQGRLESLEPTARKLKARVAVQAVLDEAGQAQCATGRLLAYLPIDAPSRALSAGDVVLLKAKPQLVPPALNPHAFDYARYLYFQNIHYQAFIRENDWELQAHQPNLLSRTAGLRHYCLRVLREHLPTENEFAVAAALVLGYKATLTEEVRNAYAHTGAMHVLAVSGLHVGFVHLLVAFGLGLLPFSGRRWIMVRTALVIACIWGFALLTGASPSVLRAATMFSFLAAGQALKRHTNIYNTLAASAFCLLCVDPYLLFSIGFQLSYLAVLGIVFFQPRIYRLWYVENKLGDYLWKLMAVSLAAQLITAPISIYYFHQFPAYFWLSGLVVVPAAAVILLSGLALFALQGIPVLGLLIGKLLYAIVWMVNALIFLIQQLPGGLAEGLWISGLAAGLLYVALGAAAAAIQSRNFRWVLGGLAALVMVALLQAQHSWQTAKQQALVIYHLNRHTAIDIFDRRQTASLQSEDLTEATLLFAAKQYRWYRGSTEASAWPTAGSGQGCNWQLRGGLLQFGALRLAIVQDRRLLQGEGILAVDAVLLCQDADISLSELREKLDFSTVIIDGSSRYRQVQRWQEESAALGLPCHYTGTDGAWVTTTNN